MGKDYPKVSFDTIAKASNGDVEAILETLNNYSGYIGKLSLRPMKDESGKVNMVVDETLRGRLEISLIRKILSFEIQEK